MPLAELRLEPQRPDQARWLWDAIDELKRGDPLAPVAVVGPSAFANLSLRHELSARGGFSNVRFATLASVAELLGAPRLMAERPGSSPMKPAIESAAVRAALKDAGADSRLSDFADNPAAIRSLRSTFRDLRGAADGALENLADTGGLRQDVVSLYRAFDERTRGEFYDAESLARAAAEAVRDGTESALDDLGFLIFYRLSALSAGEIRLVRALYDAGRCAVYLGLTGDADADALIRTLAARLSPSQDADAAPDGAEGADAIPAPPESVRLLIAPTPREEIRWALRRVMRDAENGTPFRESAILYRQAEPYSSLIAEELKLAGMPVAGPDPTPLSQTAVGRALSGMMNLAGSDFARDDVMVWLTGCPVKPPGTPAARFVPSRWDAISRRAGVVRGLEQWESRLAAFAANQERQAEGEERGEIQPYQADGLRRDASAARDLAEFVKTLAESLTPPPDGSASWADFQLWAWTTFKKYLTSHDDIPEPERDALEKIETRMIELETAQAIDPRPTFDSFRRALDEALLGPAGRLGATGEGVFVGRFADAAAMRFSTAYFVGMAEGAAPPALRENPLTPDRERLAAGGADAGLPLLTERRARERLQYLSAMATAPRRILSCPVADPVGGRENHPSRWMLEQATALAGERISAANLPSQNGKAWLTTITSPETALETAASIVPADLHDYDLERILRWAKDDPALARFHPISESGALARALDLGAGRESPALTEWDGNLSGASGLSRILNRPRHSPTSLERWASCPFSYFLGYGLRIGALDRAEDLYSISPLERGSLVHDILEKFIKETAESAAAPKPPDERWDNRDRDKLRRIAADRFAELERAGMVGRRLPWRLEQDAILADLDAFLEWDANMRARFGVSPSANLVEAQFGWGGDSPDVEIALGNGARIAFRGMADRIDAGETESGGRRALVMDYKTGSTFPYEGLDDDPFNHGKKLQLAVYSQAAREILGWDGEAEVIAAYAFVTSRGQFQFRPESPADYNSEKNQAKFLDTLGAILGGIQNGVFPANPGEYGFFGYENCSFCDFDSICSSRRDVQWNRKSGDKAVQGYLNLIREEGNDGDDDSDDDGGDN